MIHVCSRSNYKCVNIWRRSRTTRYTETGWYFCHIWCVFSYGFEGNKLCIFHWSVCSCRLWFTACKQLVDIQHELFYSIYPAMYRAIWIFRFNRPVSLYVCRWVEESPLNALGHTLISTATSLLPVLITYSRREKDLEIVRDPWHDWHHWL